MTRHVEHRTLPARYRRLDAGAAVPELAPGSIRLIDAGEKRYG